MFKIKLYILQCDLFLNHIDYKSTIKAKRLSIFIKFKCQKRDPRQRQSQKLLQNQQHKHRKGLSVNVEETIRHHT